MQTDTQITLEMLTKTLDSLIVALKNMNDEIHEVKKQETNFALKVESQPSSP